jgi:hypothetical protein
VFIKKKMLSRYSMGAVMGGIWWVNSDWFGFCFMVTWILYGCALLLSVVIYVSYLLSYGVMGI